MPPYARPIHPPNPPFRRAAAELPIFKPIPSASGQPLSRDLDPGVARRNKRAGILRQDRLQSIPKGRPLLRKALLLLSGNAAASAFLLARNLLVARLLSLADYGVAATFALTIAVVEMVSAFGLQQQIVQSKDGDDPRFQAVLQGFQLLRGAVSAMILLLVAAPIADFMGIPEVSWAYQLLALVPFVNGLQHLDIHRLSRQMRFGPMLMTGVLPAVASLALVWPLALWLDDWRVMLWTILAQVSIGALTSHLMAERPYRLAWDARVVGRSLRFGWPILANAVLLFFVFQGEKLIVGREMGMEVLGLFAMGVTLTLTPTLILAKSIQNLFLPRLSTVPEEEGFRALSALLMQILLMLALICVAGVILLGGPVIHLLLGAQYAPLLPLLIWLMIGQALRLLKAGPAIIAMARGRTANSLAGNVLRVALLPMAWWIAVTSGDLRLILWIAILAEAGGHALALGLLCWQVPQVARGMALPHLAAGGGLLVAGLQVLIFPPADPSAVAAWPLWLGSLAVLLLCLLGMHDLRRALMKMMIR